MDTFHTIVALFLIVLTIILLFYIVRFAVMIWTGCKAEEATKLIHTAIRSSSPAYHIGGDVLLIQEAWDAERRIIGDARFNNLVSLSQITPIFSTGMASGLPYIALVFPYTSSNEKIQAETLLSGIVKKYLAIHGLSAQVLIDWPYNAGLQMPVIMIRYAETEEEKEILVQTLNQQKNQIVRQYKPIVDEEIEDV